MPAMLEISQLATTYSWLPDKVDLLNGMALGAGLGAALGGGISLLPWVRMDRMPAVGTVVGVVIGGLAVAIGNAGLDITAFGDGPSLILIVVLVTAALKALPEAVTGWSRRDTGGKPSRTDDDL
jgi:hypothetical protein